MKSPLAGWPTAGLTIEGSRFVGPGLARFAKGTTRLPMLA